VNSQKLFELAAAKLDEVLAAIRQNRDLPARSAGPGSYFSFPTAQEQSVLHKRQRS
jgi:hypothetical protein